MTPSCVMRCEGVEEGGALPDARRQTRHGVSDVLCLAWLLLGVVGVASVPGVSRSSFAAKVAERFAQIVGCLNAEAGRESPAPTRHGKASKLVLIVLCRGSGNTRQPQGCGAPN
jgi:hypothetical protein